MKNKFLLRYATIAALACMLVLQSCEKEPEDPTPAKEYTNGVFITNEGAFSGGTGTVSFWSRDNQTRDNDIYNTVNGVPLGNIVQSIALHFSKAYIVVNNANKVEVANAKTLKYEGTITGLELPRYFVGLNENKGYISEWVGFAGQGRVAVVDLNTKQVTSTIPVGILPEKMTLVGNKLFVTNSNDNTVSVINTTTDAVESTITVGDWPTAIEQDKNGNMWVLCTDIPSWFGTPTSPQLIKFNANSPNAQTAYDFGTPDNNPSRMVINGSRDALYYIYSGGVYKFDIGSGALPASPVVNRSFYSIAVDPQTGNLYGADAIDFTQQGRVIQYNTSFTAIDSMTTDVAPNDFWFVY